MSTICVDSRRYMEIGLGGEHGFREKEDTSYRR